MERGRENGVYVYWVIHQGRNVNSHIVGGTSAMGLGVCDGDLFHGYLCTFVGIKDPKKTNRPRDVSSWSGLSLSKVNFHPSCLTHVHLIW